MANGTLQSVGVISMPVRQSLDGWLRLTLSTIGPITFGVMIPAAVPEQTITSCFDGQTHQRTLLKNKQRLPFWLLQQLQRPSRGKSQHESEEEKKTHRYVEGGVHEDVEDGPDSKVDPEGEAVRAFLLTPSPVFQINPGRTNFIRRSILAGQHLILPCETNLTNI